ncbi:MAG: hypothetical protein MZV63_08180 [Marinilabiliales bacterium]|nr:hypothetical protein [Marinilabiliales bacterium]
MNGSTKAVSITLRGCSCMTMAANTAAAANRYIHVMIIGYLMFLRSVHRCRSCIPPRRTGCSPSLSQHTTTGRGLFRRTLCQGLTVMNSRSVV